MNSENLTFASRLSDSDLQRIRREAEAMRAAYLRSLFRRVASAFTRHGGHTHGGLTAAR
ncbi:hypothetical protein [Azospirillum rugosum]|uniref:Uncharacterized protein n=1 Tax=Azospirillum rugosum TaxID=416170 RepID=A0ABS4SLI0_9PROT|nr:hypothetical protein [Azospirillum rugosum]MBP2292928.1 hypothetical protein [Azospirillum rugosum]MDQ0529320.1 hypothetical protein [Azospirillum rugosum]